LRYVHDDGPGITRQPRGSAFRYLGPSGKPLRDAAALARIHHLVIPPAWNQVWICPRSNGHIQVTARDARGRKQYRYHSRWRETRDEAKFHRTVAFGKALPRIRSVVARDLRRPKLDRRKILAAMIRLLETTLIRVGNREYARANHSFGLSTLRRQHAEVTGNTIHFHFRGKSGKLHRIDLQDARLGRIVRKLQELPGQELFHCPDHDGKMHRIGSEDVNQYLHEVAGDGFSAKDFRTWAGTVLAAIALRECEHFDSRAQAKRNVVDAIERVAQRLGNTPAICRKCYIHPAVLEAYLDGRTIEGLKERAERELNGGLQRLSGEEGAVLAFLSGGLRRTRPRSRAGRHRRNSALT
jgi:DNA topoisomerase-1